MRWTTAGESHGRALVALVEGMVAGLAITAKNILGDVCAQEVAGLVEEGLIVVGQLNS